MHQPQRRGRLNRSTRLGALALSALILLALAAGAQAQARTVSFPADRSMGRLEVRDEGSEDPLAWEYLGQARGQVSVPAGKDVKLLVSGAAAHDLSPLAALGPSDLQGLDLSRTGVTDAGLVHLKGLTGLPWVGLTSTRITDAGLAHLTGLSALEFLDLSSAKIGDAGLAHLQGLTSLTDLYLGGTGVTDAGLAHLTGLTRLSRLFLWGTQVTDAGVANLKQALPTCQIQK